MIEKRIDTFVINMLASHQLGNHVAHLVRHLKKWLVKKYQTIGMYKNREKLSI